MILSNFLIISKESSKNVRQILYRTHFIIEKTQDFDQYWFLEC